LLWIGPWTWNKGRHLLINAFPPLAERHPRLRLTLIGTALPEGVVLADFPSAIRPRIRVVERMPPEALPQELVAHDLFVFPSLFEGGPLSLLEAMAAGLAVVTSNCYAMAEIVTAGVDGLLVRPGDAAALADAIGHLLDHPAEAQRLGRAARARARELSWATAAQRTLDVLQRARGAAGEASLAGMAAEPERK
jgi:glycosyltransferase involved in cell wall biosynthesis